MYKIGTLTLFCLIFFMSAIPNSFHLSVLNEFYLHTSKTKRKFVYIYVNVYMYIQCIHKGAFFIYMT